MSNFTSQIITIFEGEPDCYCAIGFGIEGPVTFGSATSSSNPEKFFPHEHMKQVFGGKEVVICLDADKAGDKAAKDLAHILYPYVKQVKIIDLNKSIINPEGLDPDSTTANADGKTIRTEKDFTDLMRKLGFGEHAKTYFLNLIKSTTVYVENVDRVSEQIFKVTLAESRDPKYRDHEGKKILDITASIGDYNCNAYMRPKELIVSCPCMNGKSEKIKKCGTCSIPSVKGFENSDEVLFHLEREVPKEERNNPLWIKCTPHELLGMIQVKEKPKDQHIRTLCRINKYCEAVKIMETANCEKLLHVRLVRDVSEFASESSNMGNSDIDVEAYIVDTEIYPNKSYRFMAIQTTAWDGQYVVHYVFKADPIENAIDTFKMDDKTYQTLTIFQPRANESIYDHLFNRRYQIFSQAAGLTGRKELFFLCDLAFFSQIEIHNKKLLPEVTRGWIEPVILGDTRCGKTMAARFLMKWYKMGELVAGSSGVSRTGLLGGVTKSIRGSPVAKWGKIPMNDGKLIIIDEMSNIDQATLDDMTSSRASGIYELTKNVSAKAFARTRKIMISNKRVSNSNLNDIDDTKNNYGIVDIMHLCIKPEILSRFDIAFIVSQKDVPVKDYEASYEQISNEFTEFQCQTLIRWIYSRKPEDIVFEEGIEHFINRKQIELLEKYHMSTQLVNNEMRAKLTRMATSLAGGLVSIAPNGDYNKIYVKKEHVQFIVDMLNYLYDHPNMGLNKYSANKFATETLGDMKFLMRAFDFCSPRSILMEEEFTDKSVQQIFFDYLYRVVHEGEAIVDAMSDERKVTSNINIMEATSKFINILVHRNVFKRTRRGTFKKTPQFVQWLDQYMTEREEFIINDSSKTKSDVGNTSDQPTDSVLEKFQQAIRDDSSSQDKE